MTAVVKCSQEGIPGNLVACTHPVDMVSTNSLIAEILPIRSIFGQRWRRIREPLGPMKARDDATGTRSHSPLPTARSTRPESERLERPAH